MSNEMEESSVLCHCGRPATEDGRCPRCAYYNSVFIPQEPVFESKREVALRAIRFRKMMRGKDRFIVRQEEGE